MPTEEYIDQTDIDDIDFISIIISGEVYINDGLKYADVLGQGEFFYPTLYEHKRVAIGKGFSLEYSEIEKQLYMYDFKKTEKNRIEAMTKTPCMLIQVRKNIYKELQKKKTMDSYHKFVSVKYNISFL